MAVRRTIRVRDLGLRGDVGPNRTMTFLHECRFAAHESCLTFQLTISNWQAQVMIEGQAEVEVNSSSLDELLVAEVRAFALQFLVSAGSALAPP